MLLLRTLGGLSLDKDGAGVTGAAVQRRRLAILAILSLEPRGMSRDRLISLLWPAGDPFRARHSLDDALSALRRELHADLFSGTETVVLSPKLITSDVVSFDRAVEAADWAGAHALYQGPFLDGFRLPDAPDFERWSETERGRLERSHARVIEQLAEGAARAQDWAAAAGWWRRRVAHDPLDTRASIGLITALASAGEASEALRIARTHETIVRDDLKTEPSPAFTTLVTRVRESPESFQSPSVAPAAPLAESALKGENQRALPRSRRGALAAAGLAVAALLAVLVKSAWPAGGGDTAAEARRVAVFPFRNETGDARYDQLGQLFADAIAQRLAVVEQVVVAWPPPTLLSPVAPMEDLSSVVRAARAGTIVSGAIYLEGSTIRVQPTLIEASSNRVLGAVEPVVGAVADPSLVVTTVLDRVSAGLATALDDRLSSWMRAASQPPSYAAYQEFLAARLSWPDYRRALGHLMEAVKLDSSFDMAQIEVATAYRMLGQCDRTDSIGRLMMSTRTLAPFDRWFLLAQTSNCQGDLAGALLAAEGMARLAPLSPGAGYGLAGTLYQLGRHSEALKAFERFDLERGGREIGPTYYMSLAGVLHSLNEPAREAEVVAKGLARFPDVLVVRAQELRTVAATGRTADLRRIVERLRRMPGPPLRGVPAVIAGAAELRAHGFEAARDSLLLEGLQQVTPRPSEGPVQADERAQIHYALGHWQDAYAGFRALVARDSANVSYHGNLALAAARLGHRAEALHEDSWLAAPRGWGPFGQTFWRARIAAVLGDRDGAMEFLQQMINHMGHNAALSHWRWDMESLKGYAPFEELIRVR